LGPDSFHVVVQHAVVRRYRADTAASDGLEPLERIDFRAAERLEGDLAGWSLSPGIEALGRLLVDFADRIDHQILTMSADPLVEVAVRRANGRARTTNVGSDNAPSSLVVSAGEVQVVHVGGYWRALHQKEPATTNGWSGNGSLIENQVANLVRGHSVYVLGHSERRTGVTEMLVRLAEAQELHLHWALPGVPESAERRPRIAAGATATFYANVDLDRLLVTLARDMHVVDSPATPVTDVSTEARHVALPDLARRVGATPLRQPAEDSYDLLRQLAGRFGWRLERERGLPLPTLLFWPIRLRRPTVIHMVQAFAAAALSVHRVRVILSLDDFGTIPRNVTAGDFARRVNQWFSQVPDAQEPEIVLLSRSIGDDEVFAGPLGPGAALRATRPWAVAREYYGDLGASAYSVLAAVKILPDLDPDQAIADSRAIVQALLDQSANRLLTPLTLWAHLNRLLLNCPPNQVVTLGGEDEHRFWAHWRETSPKDQTGHLYHSRITSASNESGRMYWDHSDDLLPRLEEAVGGEAWREPNRYLPWLIRNALMLPAYLQGGEGTVIGDRRFDAWQDVLTAVQEDRGLLRPIAERISALFLHGDDT
jgi:hypothetical protein